MFSQLSEFGVSHAAHSYFNFIRFKICTYNCLKNLNSNFDSLFSVPLSVILPIMFLELCRSFLFFGASGYPSESNSLSAGINSVELRPELLIEPDERGGAAEGTHISVLWELLQVVTQLLGEHRHCDVVAVLELETRCCVLQPSYQETRVIQIAHHHCSQIIIDAENIGYWIGHYQFIRHFLLRAHHDCIQPSYSYCSLTECMNCFESVLHLIDSSIWRENFHQFFKAHFFFLKFNYQLSLIQKI